ncbi:hypothetical protein Bpfe_000041, partial [Biomphalaria pfeifferi]
LPGTACLLEEDGLCYECPQIFINQVSLSFLLPQSLLWLRPPPSPPRPFSRNEI